MKAQKLIRKGCYAFLAYILDTKVSKKKANLVTTICEISNVFPEKLTDLPQKREVEFVIKLVLDIALIFAPYRMAPSKLKELKPQL